MAEAAGITPRTLRFYRERRLLPPPRREGRIAWYDERHLARLHTIAGLLARGHTLGGIAELILAFEKGRDSDSAAELLGVSRALAPRFSEETTVRLTPEQLAALFPEEDTPENLSTAIELGYLSIEGDEITHISQRLLDASTMLVDRGVPLSAVLEAGRRMRRHVEAISADFAGLIKEHLLTAGRFEDISDAIEALRPSAKQVVEAELSMAMDRQLRREIEEFFGLPEERRGPAGGTGTRD
nr:MerR family transcriptional regulator [Streptomyces tardus]